MSGKLEKFKRAFQKAFQSAESNFKVRKGKVDAALREFAAAVSHLEKNGSPDAATFRSRLDDLRKRLGDAESKARNDAKGAFADLESVKADARARAAEARTAAKKTPMTVPLEGGGDAKLFPPDIPGFDELSDAAKARVAKELGGKISSGKALYDKLANAASADELGPPDRKAVSDLMWFLKSKAQGKLGEPFERGALTVPDPDNKLRKYLDKCSEVYGRDSSHLKDQQKQAGGQGRGIDFYEGVSDAHGIADMDTLLPSGMRTMLFQQVKTAKGEDRLYLKMETESARFNPAFRKAGETPEARALHSEDVGRSILHLGNLIKAKLGASQGEDESLATFREKIDSESQGHYEAAIASAKKKSPAALPVLKTGKVTVQQIATNIDTLGAMKVPVDPETYGHLHKCWESIDAKYGVKDADSRFGGEVVLGADDIGADVFDEPKALGRLNEHVAAVERCQHTDELADLVKVRDAARKALADVHAAKGSRDSRAVQSTSKQLEQKLAPLDRLIARMEKESPQPAKGKGIVASLDPKDKVIAEAAIDTLAARKKGQDAPLRRKGEEYAQKGEGQDKLVADPGLDKADFSEAGPDAPIVLLAHGSTPMFSSSKGNVHAVEFGGKPPEKIVDYIKKTLPKTYAGVIYLDGCFTGAGKGPHVFADKVYKGLVKAGYRYLQVKGNLGAAATTADGKELVTPADVDRYKADLEQRAQELDVKVKELEAKYTGDRERTKGEIEAIKSAKDGPSVAKRKELLDRFKALGEAMATDKKLNDLRNRFTELNKLVTNSKELQIEALTGTWGPEELPPGKGGDAKGKSKKKR